MIPIPIFPLAQCGVADEPFYCYWIDENIWDGIFQPIVTGVGSWALLAAIIAIPLGIAYVGWSRSTYLPAIVLSLLGFLILGTVPGNLARIGGRLLVGIFMFIMLIIWIRTR